MPETIYYQAQPSPKILWFWFISQFAGLFFLFVFLVITILPTIKSLQSGFLSSWVGESSLAIYMLLALLLLIPAIMIITFIYFIYLRRTYFYWITEKGVYFTGGIFVKTRKFVPFYKITDVVTSQNALEQMLGISRIGIQTAGAGGQLVPEITLEGLEYSAEPEELIRELMERLKKRE